jgi:hypothetical protein
MNDASRLLVRSARIVESIHKLQQEHTISPEAFRALMEQMWLVVARYVSNAGTLQAIETAWGQIRVEPGRLDRRIRQQAEQLAHQYDLEVEELIAEAERLSRWREVS